MEEKKTETYEQSIRRRPILRVMAWVGLVVIFAPVSYTHLDVYKRQVHV